MDNQYQKFLAPNERVLLTIEYADSELILDFILGLTPAVGMLLLSDFAASSYFVGLFFGSYFIVKGLYRKITLKYLITDRRVILKKGLIGQSMTSAEYSKITDISVSQGILGRIVLKTGTIILNTAGTDMAELQLKWIQDPFGTKNIIYQQLHRE